MFIKNNDLIIICNEEIDNEIFDLFSNWLINMQVKSTHHGLELTFKIHYQNYRIFVHMMVWNLLKSGGYQYSRLIIEYLLNTYGKEKFIKWLQFPEEFIANLDEFDINFDTYITKIIEGRIK